MKHVHNKKTGLTQKQEQAAQLFINGNSHVEVSEQLEIKKEVLIQWEELPTFRAYSNLLLKQRYEHTSNNLGSLYNEALKVIKDCLDSKNESIKLKTAMYLIKKTEDQPIGETDARAIIKKECTSSPFDGFGESVDNEKYKAMCKEYSLSEE